MHEKSIPDNASRYERNWVPNSDSRVLVQAESGSEYPMKGEINTREHERIRKEPRQSAELIKVLIEYIKSL